MPESTPKSSLVVPAEITFQEAIALTQSLLAQWEAGDLADAELEAVVTELVGSMNGARGFFVTYLVDERSPADQPTVAIIRALQSSPEIVSELLVKNLAMSAAMAITHRRQQHEEMAQGSDRVRSRTTQLIQVLQMPQIAEKADQLRHSAATGTGTYQEFLERWGYDAEQRQVMQQAITTALEPQ